MLDKLLIVINPKEPIYNLTLTGHNYFLLSLGWKEQDFLGSLESLNNSDFLSERKTNFYKELKILNYLFQNSIDKIKWSIRNKNDHFVATVSVNGEKVTKITHYDPNMAIIIAYLHANDAFQNEVFFKLKYGSLADEKDD